jgi:hypothetical protein
MESLQAEKAALDERVTNLEADNSRLRAANLEKDRKLALLLGGLSTASTRESVGGCTGYSSVLTGCSPLAGLSP